MAKQSHKSRLSPVDTAWLHMERPTTLSMVTSVMMFEKPVDWERFKATVDCRLLRFKRFRQRVVESHLPGRRPRWEPDANFSLDAHLHHVALPSPGDQAALQNLVSDLLSTPLDFSKPLWQMHCVDNFNGGSAVIFRSHHCVADGLALVHVFLSLGDTDPNAPWPVPQSEGRHVPRVVDRLIKAVGRSIDATESLVHQGVAPLVHPSKGIAVARLGGRSTKALGKVILIPPDHRTILRGKLGVTKRAAWSGPLPLGDVKRIGRPTGATINDVLVSAAAGALRAYLQDRDQPADGLDVRAVVPVNLRPPDAVPDMGNRFGLVFLSLPLGIEDPIERLSEVKARMNTIKDTPEAVVTYRMLGVLGLSPIEIERLAMRFFGLKATLVLTNVSGPRETLYMAGSRMQGLMGWVPSPGHLGLGISIVSYAGQVRLGVQADVRLIPDPQTIVDNFQLELGRLSDLTQPEEAVPGVEA